MTQEARTKKTQELKRAESKLLGSMVRLIGKSTLATLGAGATVLQVMSMGKIGAATESIETGWAVTREYLPKLKDVSDLAITNGLETIQNWSQVGYISTGMLALSSIVAGVATAKEAVRHSILAQNVERLTSQAPQMPSSPTGPIH